ncbi:Uncharacterised protein [Mycobacteroides abscessus subsp. abscessus]|nr:Uncharacterised protein [Mycobacteroides abscessus subsp. abscessus]
MRLGKSARAPVDLRLLLLARRYDPRPKGQPGEPVPGGLDQRSQVALYDALGLQVPVTDPDALAAQGKTWQPPQNTSATPTPAPTNPGQLPAAADTAPAAVPEDPVGDLVAHLVRWAAGNVKQK